jgi:hypothetical protein
MRMCSSCTSVNCSIVARWGTCDWVGQELQDPLEATVHHVVCRLSNGRNTRPLDAELTKPVKELVCEVLAPGDFVLDGDLVLVDGGGEPRHVGEEKNESVGPRPAPRLQATIPIRYEERWHPLDDKVLRQDAGLEDVRQCRPRLPPIRRVYLAAMN